MSIRVNGQLAILLLMTSTFVVATAMKANLIANFTPSALTTPLIGARRTKQRNLKLGRLVRPYFLGEFISLAVERHLTVPNLRGRGAKVRRGPRSARPFFSLANEIAEKIY